MIDAGKDASTLASAATVIPAAVHFCWIGRHLPWAYVFAVLSAAARSELDLVTLHHTDDLSPGPELRALTEAPGVDLRRLDVEACLREAGRLLGVGERLVELWARLPTPVMRSDLLRAAILHREGGIYLDLDTVTVRSLRPLLAGRPFVGTESIVWPRRARRSRSVAVLARHLLLDLVRKLCRSLPLGWLAFRLVERFYVRSANNSAMGAEPRSPFLADYMRGMLDVPAEQLAVLPYALGPHLLEDLVAAGDHPELLLAEPSVFAPLPPEISEHWFRARGAMLDLVLAAETRVVHWYASVRTRPLVGRITPDYVRTRRGAELYSTLVCSCLPDLVRPTA